MNSVQTNKYYQPSVSIGGSLAENVLIVDTNTITATTTAHAAGAVDVMIENADGQSATLTGGYTYGNPAPIVSSISPISGSTTGGTSVTISGSNFSIGDTETKLLIHADDTGSNVNDFENTPKTISVIGNPLQSNAQSKFGGSSLYFDGSGGRLSVPDSDDFDLSASDGTVDFWLYVPTLTGSTTAYTVLTQSGGGADSNWGIQFKENGKMGVGKFGVNEFTSNAGDITQASWNHVAIVKQGTSTSIYINGVFKNSSTLSIWNNSSNALYIGADGNGTEAHAMYLDELRFTKGLARWTSNFTPSMTSYLSRPNVKFGTTQAVNIVATNSSTITAITPSHVAEQVDVQVINSDGQSSTLSNGFTYAAPPTISSILPNNASNAGGDSITITGTGFYGAPNVKLGGVDATSVTVVNSTTLTATTPAHAAGTFDVVVTNSDSQNATLTNGFTFNEPPPSISSITPVSGPASGGTDVTISGSNFSGGGDVNTKLLLHADGAGNNFIDFSLSSKTITANGGVTQSSAQSKFGGKSSLFGSGSYLTVPTSADFEFTGDYTFETWVYPTSAPAATADIVEYGAHTGGGQFWDMDYETSGKVALNLYNAAYLYSITSSTALQLNTWSHVAGVRSGSNIYLFINGVLTGSATYSGTFTPTGKTLFIGRHTTVTTQFFPGYMDELRISKGVARWTTDFSANLSTTPYIQTNVTFGGVQATNILVPNLTTITATAPAHSAGAVDVVVTNMDGQSSTLSGGYTYNAAPTISAILPTSGSKLGGDSITITGTGFYGSPNLKLGGTDATNVIVVNSTTLTATTPAHAAGTFDVVVTNSDSQNATLTNGFTFNEPPPSISSITPSSGPVAGGTSVAISGLNFSYPDSYTKLLLHADEAGNNFTDSSAYAKSITANGSIAQTNLVSKFGGSSVHFDGTGDYLTVPASSDWDFGTGDFTVDTWFRWNGIKDSILVDFGGTGSSRFSIDPVSATRIYVAVAGTAIDITTGVSFTDATWYHVAVVRNSGLVKVYINGVEKGSGSIAGATGNSVNPLYVGKYSSSTLYDWQGYIDEFRISKGIARWTTNFTPPISAYSKPTVTLGSIDATSTEASNSTTITAITPAHIAGDVDVNVMNDDGQIATLTNGFAYIGPPTISEISLSAVNNNQSVDGIIITGIGFQNGATVKFKKNGESDVACSNAVFNSSTSLSCDADFHGIEPGSWDVEVTNADTQVGTSTELLSVTGEVTQINFYTPAYVIKPSVASQAIRIQLQDSAGRPTKPQSDAILDLSETSTTGEFSLSRTSWLPISSITFATTDDTKTVYYKDSTLGTYTIGASENPSVNWADASQSIIVSNGAPFVWPFDVSSDYQYDGAKISVINSDASLTDLSATGSTIANVSSAALTYSSLTSFSEVLDVDNQGLVKYQLSNNDGTTWYWWNGSTWISTTQGVTQANDATTINDHISTFNSAIGQIGNAKLSFKAFLIGDGTQKVNLDSIFVGYVLFPYKYVFIQKPDDLNETEEGIFEVQAQDQFGNVITVDHDTVVSLSSSAPATGFFATDLNEDIATRWDKQVVTISAGQNSATFYYKDSAKGNKTISANPPAGEGTVAASSGLNITSRYRFLVTGVSDPIQAGVPSSVTIQAADYLGNPVTNYVGTVHFTSSDGAASLPANYTLTAPMLGGKTFVNGVTMMTQTEQCVSVVDISDSIIAGQQCNITVSAPPAGVASKLKITSSPQFVPVGEISSSITVQLQDINGEAAVKATSTTVYVYRTTASGEFSVDGVNGWTSGAFSVVIPAGASAANFYYKDTVIGNYELTVSDDDVEGVDIGLTNYTQSLSAVAGSPYGFSFNSGAIPIMAGTSTGALNFSLHDSLGNQVTTQNNQTAIITSSGDAEFSLDGSSNWTTKLITNIPAGDFESNFYYRNSAAGSDTIIISDADPADGALGLADESVNVTVSSAAASRFVFASSPVNLNIGETSSQMMIQTQDIFGNVSAVSGDTDVYLYSSDVDTTFSAAASPFVSTDKITIPNGGSMAAFYFRQAVDNGSIVITASDNSVSPDGAAGISDATQTQTISQGAVASLVITNVAPLQLAAGQESAMVTVESRNASNVKVPMLSDTTIYFHSDSIASVKEFSLLQAPAWENIPSTVWMSGNDTLTFYYKDIAAGGKTITVGDDATIGQETGITNASLTVDVNALAPSKLKITSAPFTVEAGENGQLTIEMQDEFGNPAVESSDRVVNLTSDDANGAFSDSEGNVITTVTILAGSSSVSVSYENDVVSVQSLSIESVGLLNDAQIFEVLSGIPVSARMITADADLIAGAVSGEITVRLYNSHEIETTAASNLAVNLSSNSATGRLDSNQIGAFATNNLALIITAGASSETFYYRDTKSGNPILYSNGSGLNEAALNLNVSADQIDHLGFISASQIVTAGEISSVIAGKIYDTYENEIVISEDLLLNLTSSSASGEFSSLSSPWNAITSLNVTAGQNTFSFFYKDQTVNVAQIEVSSAYGNITQAENIILGQLSSDDPAKLFFQSAPQTIVIDSPASIEFYLADSSNRYATAKSQLVATISSDSATGRFFDAENSNWVASLDVVFEIGESVKAVEFKDSASGSPVISVISAGLISAQQQENVINGAIEKISLDVQANANTVDRIPVLIETMTNGNLPVVVTADTTINFSQSGSGYFYASAMSQTPIYSTTFDAGISAKTVYFQQTTPGTVTIGADENPSLGWTADQNDIVVSSVPTRFTFVTSIQTKKAGQQSDVMTVRLEDIYGNVSNAVSDLTLNLSSTSQFGEFSLSDSDWSQTAAVIMNAGSSTASFFYKDTLAGTQTITVSEDSYQAAVQQYVVTTSDIYSLNFLTAENNLEIGQASSAITVQAQDQYGNAKIVDSNFTVYLYSTSSSAKFSLSQNFAETNWVGQASISAGTSVATFYYRDLEENVSQLTVSDKNPLDDADLGVLNATQQITVITGNVTKLVWESVPNTIEEGDGNVPMTIKTTNSSGIEIPVLGDLPIYFSAKYETASNGSFANAASGPWGISSAVITQGSSRATFYYKDTIAGTPLITVSDEAVVLDGADSGLSNARSYVTIVQGAISRIVFNSSQQAITANHPSSMFQLQTLNRSDVPTNVSSNKIIYLRSSSASGEFSLNGQDWGINGVTISAGNSIGSFYYRDAISGSYVITAADNLPLSPDINWSNASQPVQIDPQQISHFNVRNISDPQKQGTPSSVVVSPVDAEGYVIKEYAGTIVEFKVLDENGDVEAAFLPDFPYTFEPTVDNGIKTFVNAVAFYGEGEKTFSVMDANGVVGIQQDITVVQASTNPIAQVGFIDTAAPLTVAKRTASSLITVQIQDAQADPVNVTSSDGYDVRISSSEGGEFSTDGENWVSAEIVLNIKQYTNFATFYYRNSDNVVDELNASDWNGEVDEVGIDNDTLSVDVAAGQAEYLQLTGSASQVAGTTQRITVTAKDGDGDVATSYAGEKDIIFTGADMAHTGQIATCSNKDAENIEFGTATILNFVAGQAECELKLYRKESAEIKVTDGTINTFGDSALNLSVNVAADVMNRNLSVLSAIPNPQQVGAPVVVNVLPKDIFGNISDKSLEQVLLNVNGVNIVTGQQFNYDVQTGLYQTAYTPLNSGTDLIGATLNGAAIQQDTQGVSDGVVIETIEGSSILEPVACGYLKIDDGQSENNKLVFDACIASDKTVYSDELSKSSTRGTWVSQIQLETVTDTGEIFSGEVELSSSLIKPTNMDLSSTYSDQQKYVPYVFLKVSTDGKKNLIDNSVFRLVVSNQWVKNNSIINFTSIDGNGRVLNMSQVDYSSDFTTYEISVGQLPEYVAILGFRQQDIGTIPEMTDEDAAVEEENDETQIVDQILDPIVSLVEPWISRDNQNNMKEEDRENFLTSSISKLFKIDSKTAGEIVNVLTVVSTGAAATSAGVATAASFPMLSYMFGGIRTLTAVPYRRKKEWGMVYDSQTGKPIKGALVIISDFDGRVREMKNTDSLGFYSFLASKGDYVIEVRKAGYIAPKTEHIVSFETYYDNSYIPGERIVLEGDRVISVNIPMLKQQETAFQKIFNPATVTHAIFWTGFSFSIFASAIDPSYFNFVIIFIFIANFVIGTFYKKNLKTGKVLTADLQPAGFATVKVFVDNNLVARTVANEKGIYVLVLDEGEYLLEAQSGAIKCSKQISLEKHSDVNEELILK